MVFKNILRALFGFGHRVSPDAMEDSRKTWGGGSSETRENKRKRKGTVGEQREKIFGKDEGEYVDFKEIKE